MVAEEVFENFYNFNPITQAKKVLFKISYKTIRSRSHNSEMRLRGAGAERTIFGSTTLLASPGSFSLEDFRSLFWF
jgi:hypothetical protein